jgi:3-oxoacyl-[acyl-carrier protein] reductase
MLNPPFATLAKKTILITGASSGIGRATAFEASRQGATVLALGRDVGRLSDLGEGLGGRPHHLIEFDLTDADAIPAMVKDLSIQFGRLDGLVHSAGIHSAMPLRGVNAVGIDQLLHANVTTGFLLAKALRHKQVRAATPSIVFLSSAAGLVGQSGVSAYSASKGAVIAATKSLAVELARDQIRVNCVCPGVVMTSMTQSLRETVGEVSFSQIEAAHPLGLGTPEDVAQAIVFLLSDSARWITGTALSVDGGYTAQ